MSLRSIGRLCRQRLYQSSMTWIITLISLAVLAPVALAQLLHPTAPASANAWIGIGIQEGPKGVAIDRVFPGTPGAKAELAAGDQIFRVDHQDVKTPKELISYVSQKGVGFTVEVHFYRGDQTLVKKMALEARPDIDVLMTRSVLNQKAKPFVLKDVHTGKPLTAVAGQKDLLMFWATWCPACKSTMPEVFTFATGLGEAKAKVPLPGRIVLISSESVEVLVGYFKGKSLPDNVFIAVDTDGKMSQDYMVPALPTFMVIDGSGTVIHAKVGGGSYFEEAKKAMLL